MIVTRSQGRLGLRLESFLREAFLPRTPVPNTTKGSAMSLGRKSLLPGQSTSGDILWDRKRCKVMGRMGKAIPPCSGIVTPTGSVGYGSKLDSKPGNTFVLEGYRKFPGHHPWK